MTMPVIQDELWRNPGNPGMIVVSSHSWIDEEGRLFMGYGQAKEAIRRIPEIERECAEMIRAYAVDRIYGFIPVRPSRPKENIVGFGLFQTRYRWDEPADPDLIKYSMDCLREYAQQNNRLKIRMNFPGVNNEGLPADQVAHLLIPVPATVTVCHQGEVVPSVPDTFPGFKEIYIQVEGMLQDGRYNQAVEYLMKHGFDIQSAMEQVNAVQRILQDRAQRESQRVEHWRSTSLF
ncbi:MAG: hypothetical protein ACM3PY_01405 [Omnitrophica WOR_2 bacterium]